MVNRSKLGINISKIDRDKILKFVNDYKFKNDIDILFFILDDKYRIDIFCSDEEKQKFIKILKEKFPDIKMSFIKY